MEDDAKCPKCGGGLDLYYEWQAGDYKAPFDHTCESCGHELEIDVEAGNGVAILTLERGVLLPFMNATYHCQIG